MSIGTFGDPVFWWLNSQWIQVGVSSYCSASGQASVFTSLANYSSWIQSILISGIAQVSRTYQCDKRAACGCGQNDVNITVTGVVGSDDAVEHSWSMIVSIQHDSDHWCAGSILSESFILTSATCVNYFSNNHIMNVVAGTDRISQPATIRRLVDKTHIHPNYSASEGGLHNIAIIHVDHPLPPNSASFMYSNTCVPIQNDLYPRPNSSLVVIGWDEFFGGESESGALQQMSVRSINTKDDACSSFTNDTYQFCVRAANDDIYRTTSSLCKRKNNCHRKLEVIAFFYRRDGCTGTDVYEQSLGASNK